MRIPLIARRRLVACLGLWVLLAASAPHFHGLPRTLADAGETTALALDGPTTPTPEHPEPARSTLDAGSCSLCRAGEDQTADRVRTPIAPDAEQRLAAFRSSRPTFHASPHVRLGTARAPPLRPLA